MAKPDGDTMTRVRRNNAIVTRDMPQQTTDELYTSFSPVLRFDKPPAEQPLEPDNPAFNFQNENYQLVDIDEFITDSSNTDVSDNNIDEAEMRHIKLSREIRRLANNKDDDLLAEYYFKDGISDLERYKLHQSYSKLDAPNEEKIDSSKIDYSAEYLAERIGSDSDNSSKERKFPEESGLEKILTLILERLDAYTGKIKNFFKKNIYNKLGRYYRKLDSATEDSVNHLLDKVYYNRFDNLKRQSLDNTNEKRNLRKGFWGTCAVLCAVMILASVLIISSLTDAVTGKWIVSYDTSNKPNIIMEFSAGNRASISVKADDGWHVHKKGKYKTQRKNGHDLLTITYDDGSVSRLYYVIKGKQGTFTNVETNAESVYSLK